MVNTLRSLHSPLSTQLSSLCGHKVACTLGQPELASESPGHPHKCEGTASRDSEPQPSCQRRAVPISMYWTAHAEQTNDFSKATSMGSFSAFPILDLPKSEHWKSMWTPLPPLPTTLASHLIQLTLTLHVSHHPSPLQPHYCCPLHTLSISSLCFCSRPLADHPLPSILHPAILVIFWRDQFNHDSFLLNIHQEVLKELQRKCNLTCPPRPPTICPCCLLTTSGDLWLPEYALLPLLCPPNSCPSFKTQLKYLLSLTSSLTFLLSRLT